MGSRPGCPNIYMTGVYLMDKVKLALIGAGGMANAVHYPSLVSFEDAHIAAICDLLPAKAQETADKFKIPVVYSDYKEMIEKEKPDAVYILMPPHVLFDITVYCLQKKLHVFTEKPLGVSSFQAASLARIAEQNKCITLAGYNRRFIPMLTYAKSLFKEKGIKVNHVVSCFYKNSKEALYYDGAIEALKCDMIHSVDLLRWMADSEPVSVMSLVTNSSSSLENHYCSIVRFENNVSGVLMCNWDAGGRTHKFEMHGSGLSALLDPNNKGYINISDTVTEIGTFEKAGSEEMYKYYGFWHENRHFIDCVLKGTDTDSNFDSAAKTCKLCDDIERNRLV